jgi:hypothetical protein
MKKLCIPVVEISSLLHDVALRIHHVCLCHLPSVSCKRTQLVACFVSGQVQTPALRLGHTASIKRKMFNFHERWIPIGLLRDQLTYFIYRLQPHLGINLIGFRICLHMKYVLGVQLSNKEGEKKRESIQLDDKGGTSTNIHVRWGLEACRSI